MKVFYGCTHTNDGPNVSVSERLSVFVVKNTKKYTINIIDSDFCFKKNGIIQQEMKSADYIIYRDGSDKYVIVELKGKNVLEAIPQIVETRDFISKKCPKMNLSKCFIVSSKCPSVSSKDMAELMRFRKNKNLPLILKSRHVSCCADELF